ncbi:hypothetical protein [Kordiimonas lacus]|uniref:Uncharacterized protein n=1 Tax=Kordiimonas lacus TaxID=637679 RepID=A0A1G6ZQ98_9PROT|nr:hypothetical protein [Kordiimonas lacus]SDE04025.1 hypothetical protein SAMN04488071_1884 [Kordiimonas lacus]
MLGYVVYGLIAFALGWLLFWIWDRKQSSPIMAALRDPAWITPVEEADTPEPLTAQASFDYAASYAATLKGALAAPTPAKLDRLNILLASPRNLEDQLWRDMPMRLREAFRNYGREYSALLETVADHSENPVQRYAAYRLAICLPDAPQDIRDLGLALAIDPAVKSVKRRAAEG